MHHWWDITHQAVSKHLKSSAYDFQVSIISHWFTEISNWFLVHIALIVAWQTLDDRFSQILEPNNPSSQDLDLMIILYNLMKGWIYNLIQKGVHIILWNPKSTFPKFFSPSIQRFSWELSPVFYPTASLFSPGYSHHMLDRLCSQQRRDGVALFDFATDLQQALRLGRLGSDPRSWSRFFSVLFGQKVWRFLVKKSKCMWDVYIYMIKIWYIWYINNILITNIKQQYHIWGMNISEVQHERGNS